MSKIKCKCEPGPGLYHEDGHCKVVRVRVATFGTFDLIHKGHKNIITRASEMGDELYVGVSTDQFSYKKKGHYPEIPFEDRCEMVRSIKGVTNVFPEKALYLKRGYIELYKIDILVMGSDHTGEYDDLKDVVKVVYLDRTPDVSTTQIKNQINKVKPRPLIKKKQKLLF